LQCALNNQENEDSSQEKGISLRADLFKFSRITANRRVKIGSFSTAVDYFYIAESAALGPKDLNSLLVDILDAKSVIDNIYIVSNKALAEFEGKREDIAIKASLFLRNLTDFDMDYLDILIERIQNMLGSEQPTGHKRDEEKSDLDRGHHSQNAVNSSFCVIS
jgi:hypothetical protein